MYVTHVCKGCKYLSHVCDSKGCRWICSKGRYPENCDQKELESEDTETEVS